MIPVDALARLAPFVDLPGPVVAAFATRALDVRFDTGAVLFLAGSPPRGWYVVLSGKVRVVRGRGARQHVIHTEIAGGTMGEVPLFAGGTHPASAIAAEPTRCALLTLSALRAAMAENEVVSLMLLRRLAQRTRGLLERLDDRSSRSVQARLIEFLLERPVVGASRTISLGMTQQALAEELGTVREVVSRELRSLCRNGLLEAAGAGRYRFKNAVPTPKPRRA
jgi:CRP/FNR family transcriptional regulator